MGDENFFLFLEFQVLAFRFSHPWLAASRASPCSGHLAASLALPFNVRCSMFDVRCSMFDVRCSMFDVRCSMFRLHPALLFSPTLSPCDLLTFQPSDFSSPTDHFFLFPFGLKFQRSGLSSSSALKPHPALHVLRLPPCLSSRKPIVYCHLFLT
jgi:hypothetical protein